MAKLRKSRRKKRIAKADVTANLASIKQVYEE